MIMIIVACVVVVSCVEKNGSSEGEMEKSTMEYFIKKLDLKAAGAYKDILIERKHKTDRIAPDVIRGFIEEIEVTRFSFKQGVKFEEGKATLWWFISDFGAKGKPEDVMVAVRSLLEKHGFNTQEPIVDENGWEEYRFVKETDEVDYLVKMKELDRFIGSKEPMCGGDVICDITWKEDLPRQTVAGMIALYPEIACPELPSEVLNYVKEKEISHMSYGGTWERYYTWGVAIPVGDEKGAAAMAQDIAEIIGKLGFSLWREEDNENTYQRKGTGSETPSFMDLEIDGSLFELRFQPRS
jgi:hypothetical protein